MKKLYIILISIMIFASCKKEDPSPTLTGTWDLYETFTSGGTYSWKVEITQSGNSLTGNTVISDNSGYALLLSSSSINGNNVTIEWMVSTYKLSHKGTVNAAFTSINGTVTSNGVNMGTWLANKKK